MECPMPSEEELRLASPQEDSWWTGLDVQRLSLKGVPDVREVQTIEVGR